MGEPDLDAATTTVRRVPRLHEVPALEAVHDLGRDEAAEHRLGHGLAERHQLERVALVVVECAQPLGDEVTQPHPGTERPVPAPQPHVVDQRARGQPLGHQLAEEQGVAARRVEQSPGGEAVDRAAQSGADLTLTRDELRVGSAAEIAGTAFREQIDEAARTRPFADRQRPDIVPGGGVGSVLPHQHVDVKQRDIVLIGEIGGAQLTARDPSSDLFDRL